MITLVNSYLPRIHLILLIFTTIAYCCFFLFKFNNLMKFCYVLWMQDFQVLHNIYLFVNEKHIFVLVWAFGLVKCYAFISDLYLEVLSHLRKCHWVHTQAELGSVEPCKVNISVSQRSFLLWSSHATWHQFQTKAFLYQYFI